MARNRNKWDISGHGGMDSTFSTYLDSHELKSITVLLGDKLTLWPHPGLLQSGLAWTIASLCWSIPRFSLAHLRQADHSLSHILPSSPACLRSASAQLPMISRALGIKSRTVWKDLQDGVEKNHPGFWHRKPPSSVSLFSPSIQHSSLACGTGACKWHYDSPLWWHHAWNDVRRPWNRLLHRHLMI